MQKNSFSWWKVALPTLIGVGVIGYMFIKEFDLAEFQKIKITGTTIFWFVVALLFMMGRDAGFTIRYRYLTQKKLSWLQALKITLLAEFGSAVTPSTVGGSSMAVLFMAKEKIPVGESTAMVFVTMLLDEMFFVCTFPILLLFIPFHELFDTGSHLTNSVLYLFVAAYLIKVLLCLLLVVGLFIKPILIKKLLITFFRLPFFRKWHNAAVQAGDDLIVSAKEMKGKKLSFWLPLILATILSWSSRYLVINALFMAFFPVHDNLLIFARQFVMWVVMVISPTPGGTGVTEWMFSEYLKEFIPFAMLGITPVIILLWRLLTYYNYLFIGAFLVPRWIKKSFKSNNH